MVQETRTAIAALNEQIRRARELREQACDLRQENADLREFLRETLLKIYSLRERRQDSSGPRLFLNSWTAYAE